MPSFSSQPVPAVPSTFFIYPTLPISSLPPPGHWHLSKRKEKWLAWQLGRIRLIEIDGSGPRRPPFYCCSKKCYQGLMEPRSVWSILWLRRLGVYWTCKEIGMEVEREINLNSNWLSCRRVGRSRAVGWYLEGVGNTLPKSAPGPFVVSSVRCEQGVSLQVWFDYNGCISLSHWNTCW